MTTISIPVAIGTRMGRPVLILHKHFPAAWNRWPNGDAWIEWETLAMLVHNDALATEAARQTAGDEAMPVADTPPRTDEPSYLDLLDDGRPPTRDKAASTNASKGKAKTGKVDKVETKKDPYALPAIREVVIPDGVPSLVAMEDAPLAGSDSLEWNTMAHVIRQYQVLTRPLPLLGGAAMELEGDTIRLAALLREEYPWMEKAIEAVSRSAYEQLAGGRPWFRMQPTILVGPPGSGKTSFVRSLATMAGLGWNMLDCAATHDAVTIAGTPRGYNTATPNFGAVCMEKSSTANPLIHLDEIEKATRSNHGYVPDAVLGLTEPVTASAYYDQCLQRVVDLSACSWIATANDVFLLGGAIRSRFRIINVPAASGRHVEAVIRSAARSLAAEWGMDPSDLAPIPRKSMELLGRQLDAGSLRTVSRSLRALWTRDITDNGRGSLQ